MNNFWEDEINRSQEEPKEHEEVSRPEYPSVDLQGLLRLGKLSEEVEIWGNKIGIRTLTIGEELEASLIAKKYGETMDAERAYATALVAASVQYENGVPLVRALGPEKEGHTIERRFRYIQDNWYWPVVQAIYSHYAALVKRVDQSLGELEKKSERAIAPSQD